MTENKRDEGRSESTAYETRDIKVRPLVGFAAGLAVLIIFSFLVVLWVFRLFSSQHAAQDAQAAPSSSARPTAAAPADEQLKWPEPRVQSRPADDLKALREGEDASLTTYGWVDRAGGVVRVPIDVAMQLILKEGLPARQPATVSPAAGSPETGSSARVIAPKGAGKKQKSP
ncbi:MAG: hypothetical protein NT151_01815 [Acidobacteria bacterium]|nr:hypothetical protein [Acidobacteriota bacterium]